MKGSTCRLLRVRAARGKSLGGSRAFRNAGELARSICQMAQSNSHAARAARLRYVSCAEAGIRRVSQKSGFVYLLPNGAPLRDPARLEQIRKLALPPAWTNVWICPDPRGHLQATGYDSRGRKQYRYNPRWREIRDDVKYQELEAFGRTLPKLRQRLGRDLSSKQLTKDKVLATVVTLMARTGLRVGNDRYVEQNGSFGLTTLLDRHARFHGRTFQLCFRGKGGKPFAVEFHDPSLARIVRRCRDIPGQRLFQYFDQNGERQSITSTDVNRYLKRATGGDFSAKTFRTWTATVLACELLLERLPSISERQNIRQINQVIKRVSEQLGNTPAICKKSYVDPRVTSAFSKGILHRASRIGIVED